MSKISRISHVQRGSPIPHWSRCFQLHRDSFTALSAKYLKGTLGTSRAVLFAPLLVAYWAGDSTSLIGSGPLGKVDNILVVEPLLHVQMSFGGTRDDLGPCTRSKLWWGDDGVAESTGQRLVSDEIVEGRQKQVAYSSSYLLHV